MQHKTKVNCALIALPWANFKYPSSQIAILSSYAKKHGHKVDCFHLHLEIAAELGLRQYENIIFHNRTYCHLIPCLKLFPKHKKIISHYINQHIKSEKNLDKLFFKYMQRCFNIHNWGKYNLIGFSATFNQLLPSLLFAKWVKDKYPKKKIIFGGSEIAGEIAKSVLEMFSFIDYCVDGEGEISFVKLLHTLELNFQAPNLNNVPGLVYRQHNSIKKNKRSVIANLDKLPIPNYDSYFEMRNSHPKIINSGLNPCLVVENSRGCPFNCAFCNCNMQYNTFRNKSAEKSAAEIKYLVNKYKLPRIIFSDNLIAPKVVDPLFDQLNKDNKQYHIFCEIRAGLNKDQLKKMKQAGVATVQVGIESLSTSLLFKMNKKSRTIDNLQTMKYCQELNIELLSNFIISFPTERQKDINEIVKNIDYACAYAPPVRIINFMLQSGSTVFQKPKEYGVHSVKNSKQTNSTFPKKFNKLNLSIEKQFKSNSKRRKYDKLFERYQQWQDKYEQFSADNLFILKYYDMQTFLTIEDYRFTTYENMLHSGREITLEDKARELYLFCDSIKSLAEIKKHFPKWNRKELKCTLAELIKLKLMFTEDDDYLSLALKANPTKN